MQNILLLTDFSENANNAIEYATQLLKGEATNFYVLNVQKASRYITSDLIMTPKKSVYDSVIKNPKEQINILVKNLAKRYDKEDFYFEGICDYDSFISAVKQVIEIKNIDFVVMGTNGISGVKEVVFGSNTIQVVRIIDLPILVVPENYEFNIPDKILFINETDSTIASNISLPLNYLIEKYNSQLYVLSINKKNKNSNDWFKSVKPNYFEVGGDRIENTIENFVKENKIDLVAKVVHIKSFFERIFSSSSTPKITYISKAPILFL
ncbi:universal stress protein [Aureibaculum conchae]|uniref:universal stress protein n=1 Tax=Aureibaculum sp. 2308TA14-22 TaxID=3108392 RepID=UPI003398F38A